MDNSPYKIDKLWVTQHMCLLVIANSSRPLYQKCKPTYKLQNLPKHAYREVSEDTLIIITILKAGCFL